MTLTRGFNLAQLCDPTITEFLFWPMSDDKELNSTSLTLVILFDLKHFVVEKNVQKSSFSSTPNRQYSVSQVARFTLYPRRSHKAALKLSGRHLLETKNKGFVVNPTRDLKIDTCPDADFVGLYNYEDFYDSVCIRSRTGYVINVAGCHVLWKSQLQTEISTSTMQAAVIVLAACCRELIPTAAMVKEVGTAVGLSTSESIKTHVCIHEDNAGALVLAQTTPPQFTPASKHYAVKLTGLGSSA